MWWPFRPSSPGKEGGTTPTSVLRAGVTTAASVTWQWTERTSLLSTWTVASTRANTLITRSRRKSNSNKKWLAENRRKFCVSVQTRCIVGITGTVHTFVLCTHLYKHFHYWSTLNSMFHGNRNSLTFWKWWNRLNFSLICCIHVC